MTYWMASRTRCSPTRCDAPSATASSGGISIPGEWARQPCTYHLFPAAEGGGEHCQAGAVSRLHQVAFGWLDTVLATPNMPSRSVS